MNGNDSVSERAGADPHLRRDRTRFSGRPAGTAGPTIDRLPPHSPEAEAGVLGCVLLSPVVLADCLGQFGADKVFYDLRYQLVWDAMTGMASAGKAIDLITLQQALKDAKQLDQVGGLAMLGALPDTVPSAANWKYYADIVWEKFLLRRTVRFNVEAVERLYEWEGEVGLVMDRLTRDWETIARLQERGTVTPRYLVRPAECADEVMAKWMSGADGTEPGLELAFPFPMKVRRKESTLVTGDNGGGKSTALSYILLHLASHPGEKLCIASMEVPKEVTLWVMGSQLLGMKRLVDSAAGMAKGASAIAWLNQRVVIYDFLGIAAWREMLDTFRYAAEHLGCTQFMVDSVMKIGVADDDYAGQGYCASAFADFAMKQNAHLWYVVHENKSGDRAKGGIRGSKQWSDNACNILRIERNLKKAEKVGELLGLLESERNQRQPDRDAIEEMEKKLAASKLQWDTRVALLKQRYPGTRQNASGVFYFDQENFQIRKKLDEPAVNWLDKWGKRKGAKAESREGEPGETTTDEHG